MPHTFSRLDYVLKDLGIPDKGTGGVSQNFQKFRVRLWKCYRTHRSSGYCGTGLQNSQKFRAGTKHTCCTRTPGVVARVAHDSQKVRGRV